MFQSFIYIYSLFEENFETERTMEKIVVILKQYVVDMYFTFTWNANQNIRDNYSELHASAGIHS